MPIRPIIKLIPIKNRPKGRPKVKWRDQVKINLKISRWRSKVRDNNRGDSLMNQQEIIKHEKMAWHAIIKWSIER